MITILTIIIIINDNSKELFTFNRNTRREEQRYSLCSPRLVFSGRHNANGNYSAKLISYLKFVLRRNILFFIFLQLHSANAKRETSVINDKQSTGVLNKYYGLVQVHSILNHFRGGSKHHSTIHKASTQVNRPLYHDSYKYYTQHKSWGIRHNAYVLKFIPRNPSGWIWK